MYASVQLSAPTYANGCIRFCAQIFLEDQDAIPRLVANQYKIAPDKLLRTHSMLDGTQVASANGEYSHCAHAHAHAPASRAQKM